MSLYLGIMLELQSLLLCCRDGSSASELELTCRIFAILLGNSNYIYEVSTCARLSWPHASSVSAWQGVI